MAKILIVDDSSYARTLVKRMLEKEGHEVCEASSGMDALEQLPTCQPDLVTMDLLMPGMEGLELIGHLKSMQPDLKIIVITADIQDETRRELMDAGADAFLNKPVSPEVLVNAVRSLFVQE
jgi:CheY-like chemotaxis protein